MVKNLCKNKFEKIIQRSYDKGNSTQCCLCPNLCILKKDQIGACFVRKNVNNTIELSEYGKITTISVDPIEKKPFYHYMPGSKTLSFGGFGCSMRCDYCENYEISQKNLSNNSTYFSPSDLCDIADSKNCDILCFTYNEPIIYFEYAIDVSIECKKRNKKFILKTNAYCGEESWKILCEHSDAINIDWKGSRERYKIVTSVDHEFIYDRIKDVVNNNIHLEISVPVYYDSKYDDYNDFMDNVSVIDNNIPIHLLKIFPANKLSYICLTSDVLIKNVYKILKNKMNNVYIHGSDGNCNV